MRNLHGRNQKLVWDRPARSEYFSFAEGYKAFLDACKTEREAAARVCAMAGAAGFSDLNGPAGSEPLTPGSRLYLLHLNKAAALFVAGQEPLTAGLRILCAHLDSPRLDLRQNPLREESGLALLKTHYYGGMKKYQWAALPLALHGVVMKADGTRVSLSIGEAPDEPVLYISDLPKHLSAQQLGKPMSEGITGEDLNLVAGSIPLAGADTDPVRQQLLQLLSSRYGIGEADLACAELEAVPAGHARDAGLDGSMVVSYGQDDRICAYTALQAILQTRQPRYSSLLLLVDKEEVGSQGATGMHSHLMENIVGRLLDQAGLTGFSAVRQALEHSQLLSADVTLGYDPSHPEAYEPGNTAQIGGGPAVIKYAGHLGKNGANDASAEFLALLRDVFDAEDICWQTGEYGRIDLGGGGTIAPFAAAYGMQVADFGVPLLSMRAPYELSSKADLYEAFRAYRAFLASPRTIEAYL